MRPPKFSAMPYTRPDVAALRRATDAHLASLRDAATADRQADVLKAWDREQVEIDTASALAHVRYQIDTRDEAAKAERERLDEMEPDILEERLRFLRALVASPHRAALEKTFGKHAFVIWETRLRSFDPAIADHRRAEARLGRRYTELTAGIHVELRGKKLTLSQLAGSFGDADRTVRRDAQRARFDGFARHRDELDSIYAELVALRDEMGRKLGHDGYVPLAYILRRRDYAPADVERYRKQVREVIVPLASRIRKRHAEALGVSDYDYPDTFVRDKRGMPKPAGDMGWMLERATRLFTALGPDFGEMWSVMRDAELLDLPSREGKAGGGFCTRLPSHRVPFVFANFNGTAADVDVFTHEFGHAFQGWRSMATQPISDYHGATADAAEIHSMGLEMLCHPHADLFFEGDASRYRAGHLEDAVLFIPYGACVDEYQHEVYRQPGLTPSQRAELWRELERAYLPERRYEGLPHAASGRFWQVQRHVYLYPFYYVDYCLAQTCALQFFQRAQRDRGEAMAAYRLLCDLGGSLPFTGLVARAGLRSPFEAGTLASLAEDLERVMLG